MVADDPHLGFSKCYRIVDLGCASGPNSIWAVAHIVDKIEELCRQKNINQEHVPEFEVFLNDLPDNDFNNLFKLLPNICGKGKGRRLVYAVPGSFYERIFARRTLHFAYSSYCLHWLSQVPEGLESNNKENIYLAMGSSPEVFEAYSNQFQTDFCSFLRIRSEEIVKGGRMVLSFMGRGVEDPSTYADSAQFTLMTKSFLDMVAEGLVKREDLYSFNLPFYTPSKQEVKSMIENQCSFTLDKIHDFCFGWDTNDKFDDIQEDPVDDKCRSGKLVADGIRALMEPMITNHFGSSILDGLFERYAKKVADHMSAEKSDYLTIVISMTRN